MVVLLLLFLSANLVQLISAAVPVVIWGSEKSLDYSSPPLLKLSTEDFSEIMKDIVGDDKLHNVAVFVQESLSMEDLGWRDLGDGDAYPNLAKELAKNASSKYFSYVQDPVSGLKSLSDNGFQISDFNDKKVLKTTKNLFIIKLADSASVDNRLKLLRRHDNLIHDVCNKIKVTYDDAICILTGLRSSWAEPNVVSPSRKLLQTVETPQYPENFFKAKNWALFYTKQSPLLEDVKNNKFYNVTFNNIKPPTGSITKQIVNVLTTANIVNPNDTNPTTIYLKFIFSVSDYAWQLTNISLAIPHTSPNFVVLNTTSEINGNFNFSFHTPSPVIFSNPDYKLTFYSMQLELFIGQDRDSFSTAEDTVGFFTIPIWSGLFVTSLLVTIVLVGLSLIFDIKTMDQFDDPKGKTVTINASE